MSGLDPIRCLEITRSRHDQNREGLKDWFDRLPLDLKMAYYQVMQQTPDVIRAAPDNVIQCIVNLARYAFTDAIIRANDRRMEQEQSDVDGITDTGD